MIVGMLAIVWRRHQVELGDRELPHDRGVCLLKKRIATAYTSTHYLGRCLRERTCQPLHHMISRVPCFFWPNRFPLGFGRIQHEIDGHKI